MGGNCLPGIHAPEENELETGESGPVEGYISGHCGASLVAHTGHGSSLRQAQLRQGPACAPTERAMRKPCPENNSELIRGVPDTIRNLCFYLNQLKGDLLIKDYICFSSSLTREKADTAQNPFSEQGISISPKITLIKKERIYTFCEIRPTSINKNKFRGTGLDMAPLYI